MTRGPPVLDGRGSWTPQSIYALALLTLIYTLSNFDRGVLAILLPLIKQDIHLSDTTLGLVAGAAFGLFYSLVGIPVARLADVSNRRNIIGVGVAVWSLMTLLTGSVVNLWQLAATRLMMGAGEAAAGAPPISMISDLFPGRQRGLALAVFTSGVSLSQLVFTPLAGWFGHVYGWRPVYWTAGLVGLVISAVFLATVREPVRGRWDAKPAATENRSLAATAAFLGRQKAYLFTVLGGAMVMIAGYGMVIWGSTFLVRVHHLDVAKAAAVTGPIGGVLGLVGAFSAGALVDRLSALDPRWRIWLPGLACLGITPAQLLYLFAPSLVGAMIGQALYSLLWGMLVPLLFAVLIALVPARMRSVGVSIYLLVINTVGQIVGPFTVGALNDRLHGAVGDMAIRYSMTVTASTAAVSGALFLLASIWFVADRARADQA